MVEGVRFEHRDIMVSGLIARGDSLGTEYDMSLYKYKNLDNSIVKVQRLEGTDKKTVQKL